ncbi:MAG: hypothetical protein IJS09_02885 [Treponema sp.]|nr:hypothetical protein [Treponema sp.]
MEQTKPRFLVKKIYSILRSVVIVEIVSYVVSLTDTAIAGLCLGKEAFASVGLLTPVVLFSTFITAVVNSGTVIQYSYYVGKFDREKADDYLRHGLLLASGISIVFITSLLLFKGRYIESLHLSATMAQYVDDYYSIIVFFFMLDMVSCILDNLTIAEGGESFSAVANVMQILGNVILSALFAFLWGVRGIAIGSVLLQGCILGHLLYLRLLLQARLPCRENQLLSFGSNFRRTLDGIQDLQDEPFQTR